ncbi:hypothetical protein [Azospirillum sp.]|uniref:hypothetical protein n=1 Tax=Azospirillum sp. TaxID=34012 RepID=UPI002D3B82DA|nr:hypothetical protein [Azospirillum sp.]HYD65319.1 hypothetical protein [Azospirillum sp.]
MFDTTFLDPRLLQVQRFKEIAARMQPGLARSGILAAAHHLEQEVLERPDSTVLRLAHQQAAARLAG